ncbi:MAG TPA: isoleucine--tRNA ligase, partial [Candidatus Aciduliprofundum boonei]|nr:isoleucine--tRNA ligase [Candidatus Aciduliprofundum boonei]
PKRFYEKVVKDVMSKFLLTLWNVFSYYETYARLDDFDYGRDAVKCEERELIDKWILSRLHNLIKNVEEKMEVFEVHKAARAIEEFVIEDLSNWYLRNSRKRFWSEERSKEKMAGYSTLYEVLTTVAKIIAPFTPFIAEKIYLEMEKGESVHLCDYPESSKEMINEELEERMETVRKIVEEARALRAKHGIKLRRPLKEIIIVADKNLEEFAGLIKDEINVKNVVFATEDNQFMEEVAKPNYAKLGPKFKEKARQVAEAIEKAGKEIRKVEIDGKEYELSEEDFIIEKKAKEGYAVGSVDGITIALNLVQTPELIAEGFAREIVRRIQEMRKEMNLEMEERIVVEIDIDKEKLGEWENYVKNETRSDEIIYKRQPEGEHVKEWEIEGEKINIGIRRK